MTATANRRSAMLAFGIGLASATVVGATAAAKSDPRPAGLLRDLMARLAKAPRRRDFKTVPMVLTEPDQWDHEAIAELMAYKAVPKQAWDNSDLAGPWLDLMHNALTVQVSSFKHADFLAVSLTRGSAQLALYDQASWDKYGIAALAGPKFPTNTALVEGEASITALMQRGVVFLSCHNAIWGQASRLHEIGHNPDKLSVDQLAADLTNHLIPGAVLTPGAVGTMVELQQAGFHYAYAS